ncbi:MAG: hypothetical protein LBU69_02290 [Deltaproteobacteria bacterium]|nr:hypothetical protein [Deltaproteobacteria bacterium]
MEPGGTYAGKTACLAKNERAIASWGSQGGPMAKPRIKASGKKGKSGGNGPGQRDKRGLWASS